MMDSYANSEDPDQTSFEQLTLLDKYGILCCRSVNSVENFSHCDLHFMGCVMRKSLFCIMHIHVF